MNFTSFLYAPVIVGIIFYITEKILKKSNLLSFVFLLLQIAFILNAHLMNIQNTALYFIIFAAFHRVSRTFNESKDEDDKQAALIIFSLYMTLWFLFKYAPVFSKHIHLLGIVRGKVEGLINGSLLVGLSYIGFKLIHYYIDCAHGKIKKPHLFEFLSWLFFFPSIIAGPIQRFQDWQKQRSSSRHMGDDIQEGAKRIIEGLFKKFVIANSIYNMSLAALNNNDLQMMGKGQFLFSIIVYAVYIYMDFAGYSDIAIGLGRFWGVTLPENFNYPYFTRNIQEFWKSWHMTLSNWLKDYIFFPFGTFIMRKSLVRRFTILGIIIPPIVTFTIAGIWHGATAGFLLWGILHGIGLACVALLGRKINWEQNRYLAWWKNSRGGYILSVCLNLSYIFFAWIPFALSDEKLKILLKRILH
ncbi:MAG: MBOAT family O-acyltransferase [bacterium]